MILRYINFESTELFEDWQKTYKPIIHQVQPQARELNFDTANTGRTESEIVYGVFVMYRDLVEVEK